MERCTERHSLRQARRIDSRRRRHVGQPRHVKGSQRNEHALSNEKSHEQSTCPAEPYPQKHTKHASQQWQQSKPSVSTLTVPGEDKHRRFYAFPTPGKFLGSTDADHTGMHNLRCMNGRLAPCFFSPQPSDTRSCQSSRVTAPHSVESCRDEWGDCLRWPDFGVHIDI